MNRASEKTGVPVNGTITHLWSDTSTGVMENLALRFEDLDLDR